ncbi:MAG: PQQ-binding-like beta-propeller repeat protein [Planctomycetes bacterium]|nr:PQQ-binding-like beta-propeller repeat protein [Planctomycetota bacterium]
MDTRPIVLRALAFTASLALLHAAIAGDSWPGYRGPTADGRSDAKNLVTTWSEKENVLWKTPIHGKGWSSPVILGKQVWLTTADEVHADTTQPAKKGAPPANAVKEVTFFALCIDRDTGKIVQDVKLGTEANPAYCHPFNSYASPTPFIEQNRLYAHFGSHGTWCVDTDSGKVLWERKDLKCDHFRGPASSPIVFGDLVFLIFDGFDLQYVAALDKTSGKTVWKTDRKIKYSNDNGDIKKAYATPVVLEIGGRQQLVCPSAECTMAYDPKTGEELWRVTHGGMNGSARAVMGNGMLYLTAGHPSKIIAVKTDAKPDSTGMLPKEAVVWSATKNVPTRPSVTLDGDLLYMVSDNAIASCLEATTGKVLWSERLDGEFSSSPVLANGNLYCSNQQGKTFVLSAGKTFNAVAENRLGEGKDAGVMASPAIAGDVLFLRTKTHLYALGKR